MGTLYTIAIPIYDSKILKSRFEESKVTLQAIMLAQERFRVETGSYYSITSGSIDNEAIISDNLNIDLSSSNNFAYQIIGVEDGSYRIKSILRPDEWASNCDNDITNEDHRCKQDATLAPDSWVSTYTRDTDKHYLEVRFPTALPNSINGIDYSHIYIGD